MKEGHRLDGLKMKRRGRRYECMRTMKNQGERLVVVCAEHCGGRCGETTLDPDHVRNKEGMPWHGSEEDRIKYFACMRHKTQYISTNAKSDEIEFRVPLLNRITRARE